MGHRDVTTTSLDQRILDATTGALELFGIYLGDRLGLYDALRGGGHGHGLTAAELATAGRIDVRYAREWSEQQAVAGVLAVDDERAPAAERRYSLPAAHVGVLADPRSGGERDRR